MQERETGKQRSQRIQIDYFRHKTGLDALKRACILAGLVGGGLYAIYVLAAGGDSHTSTGPVALAHASFETKCSECHQSLSPIAADAARPNIDFLGIKTNKLASIRHTEAACQKCHHVGDHYRNLMKTDWQLVDQNCANCHSDHQGRDFDLTFVSKQHCTSCHAKLSEVCAAKPQVKQDTDAFNKAAHGDFASLMGDDPGVVLFDHHQHMMPGQVNDGEKGAFTIAMLEPTMRGRAAGQDDTSPVTLDCSSCHEIAGSPESNISQLADSELGRYIKPISFDQHCSACHPINPAARTEETLPLPHAAPWSEIDVLMRGKIAGMRATGKMRNPRDDSQTTPQPGVGTGTPAALAAGPTESEVAAARKLIETGCKKCHDAASITDDAIMAGRNGTAGPMIPGRWLKHGLYDHAAHLNIDCRYCHSAAYPAGDPSPQPPHDHQVVMIDGIDSCTFCHRDAETPTPDDLDGVSLLGSQPTWASDNCTLCHRYHTAGPAAVPPVTSESPPLASTEAGP